MLSNATLASMDQIHSAFANARPFRHVVIDGFLDDAHAREMLEQFPGFDRRFALNEMGEVGGKAVRTGVRGLGPVYERLDDYIRSEAFLEYLSRVTGIPGLLYDPDYEGGGTHENRNGQGLDAHIDFNYHPRTGWHRRLNLIIYLNPQWERSWGGALEIIEDPWTGRGERVEVLPLFNRCVVFETNEVSWHGFQQIRLPVGCADISRRSFAIYLYTRDRPAEETAPPHATVYVPDGMPGDLLPGVVLDQASVDDLRARFARQRAQLKYLYEREKTFTAQIESLRGALEESRAAQRVDLLGYARVRSVSGIWPDGWCGRSLHVEWELDRPLQEVLVEGWAPPELPAAQRLTWRLSGQEGVGIFKPGQSGQIRIACRAEAGASLRLEVGADGAWCPASDGGSGDLRELAWRLIRIDLRHR